MKANYTSYWLGVLQRGPEAFTILTNIIAQLKQTRGTKDLSLSIRIEEDAEERYQDIQDTAQTLLEDLFDAKDISWDFDGYDTLFLKINTQSLTLLNLSLLN